MTSVATVFLILAGVASVLDWIAVAKNSAVLEYVSKPGATAAFLITAATLDVAHTATWGWRIAALAFCILGDVFLMLPKDAFIQGLASFAIAQVMFTISFTTGDIQASRVIVGLCIAVAIAFILARRFVTAIKKSGHHELVGPVMAYVVVISAMAVGAIASGSVIAIVGAFIFMVSDSLIAESRFVNAKPWHPVGTMVTYHLALAGLVLSLV